MRYPRRMLNREQAGLVNLLPWRPYGKGRMKYFGLAILTAGLFTTFTTSSAQTASAPLRVAIAGMVHGHIEGFF